MSGLPVTTAALPSALTVTVALEFMPALNQNPTATPRPWLAPSGARQCGWFRAASSTWVRPIGPYFGPYGARSPSAFAFSRRSAIGSIASSRAISSTTDSTANAAIGEPGARYAATFGLLTTTSYASMKKFGTLYAASAHIAPAPAGDPLYAPASYHNEADAATSVPSRFAPSFTRTFDPDVGPVARNTSSRPITIFTGRCAFRESARASGSRYTTILPPKPPPISLGMTLTCAGSRPAIAAQASRTTKGPCVEHHTTARPSSPHRAMQACGSM